MLYLLRREHLVVAVIFASLHLLRVCNCVCDNKNEDDTDLEVEDRERARYENMTMSQVHGSKDLYRKDWTKIDAFNYKICGKSYKRDWHLKQKAWGCRVGRSTGGQRVETNNCEVRIADGEEAKSGEFPSFVHLLIFVKGSSSSIIVCGGTLIHTNLVITVAHCLTDATSIIAVVGSNRLDGSGGYKLSADSWCYHAKYSYDIRRGPQWDLGMVRLSPELKYIPNTIQPACLLLNKRHKSNSACAVIGLGHSYGETSPNSLKTLPVRRTCNEGEVYPFRSCYHANTVGGVCRGDSGSGVYCYDNCYAGDQRAFVVAAVSGGDMRVCVPGQRFSQFFTDFNWMANSIRDMVNKLNYGGSGRNLICKP